MKPSKSVIVILCLISFLNCKENPFSVFADSESDFKLVIENGDVFSYEGNTGDSDIYYSSWYYYYPTTYYGESFDRLMFWFIIGSADDDYRIEATFYSYSYDFVEGEYSILDTTIEQRRGGKTGFSSRIIIEQRDSITKWLESSDGKLRIIDQDDGSKLVMFDINYRSTAYHDLQNVQIKGKLLSSSDTE